MLFNSIDFLIFFPIVTAIYLILPKKVKYIWLLIASFYFYMSWNPKYIVLIVFSIAVTYAMGLIIEKAKKVSAKKWVLGLGIAANLGVLFLFKYLDFFFDNMNSLLSAVGIHAVEKPFDFLLPVGISFYTFQAIGYCIDVYRGEIKAERNIARYALFVSFFPQLVAGPIERSKNLLSQLKEMGERRLWTYDGIVSGFGMMLWGLFMKMMIADRVGIFVDAVYDNLFMTGTVETAAAAVGFSLQIYADFAGYSAIAIGAARVIGIDLMENFNTPYFSTGIADFWRRWHISLSTWFRDYLYIPLGGNRKGKFRKYLNLLITFLVSGLWHGASWTFVIWGGIHAVYQIIEDLFKPVREKIDKALNVNRSAFSYKFGQIFFTFILTTFAWIFFRARSISVLGEFLRRLFTKWDPWVLSDDSIYSFGLDAREMIILFASVFVLLIVSFVRYKKEADIGEILLRQNRPFRIIVFILLIMTIIIFGEYGIEFDSNKFIYFDF